MSLPPPSPPLFRQALDGFLGAAWTQCSDQPGLRTLKEELERHRKALAQPMRVAFVGTTNSGKSTMMNAFLGVGHAPMGNGELTTKVCWFRHGAQEELRVHDLDGRVWAEPIGNLQALTARGEGQERNQQSILYLEIRLPNPMLKAFDLIDTPGLHSFYGESRETAELLAHPDHCPHALVFLFSMALQEHHMAELEKFHQHAGSLMTGLTAIGAHTKVDGHPNDLEGGWEVIRQIERQHPRARRMFYRLLPTMGKLAYGAQTLGDAEWDTLRAMAALPEPSRGRLLRSVEVCTRRPFEDPAIPPPEARGRVFEKLDLKGIQWAFDALDQGMASKAEVMAEILDRSQVGPLRDTVLQHFGGRAELLKSKSALDGIRARAEKLRARLWGEEAATAGRIAAQAEDLVLNQPRFREFLILEDFYNGKLQLDAQEEAWLLEVTGERGPSCASRLGLDGDAPLAALEARALERLNYWLLRANDNPFLTDEQTRRVARTLQHSYSHILKRIQDAGDLRQRALALLASD